MSAVGLDMSHETIYCTNSTFTPVLLWFSSSDFTSELSVIVCLIYNCRLSAEFHIDTNHYTNLIWAFTLI